MPERADRPTEFSRDVQMAEQRALLRDAYAADRANARGVVEAELNRNRKIADGLSPDPRLRTEEAMAEARWFLGEYQTLKEEFGETQES